MEEELIFVRKKKKKERKENGIGLRGGDLGISCFIKGDLKAPFSIATTLKCRGGLYSIP